MISTILKVAVTYPTDVIRPRTLVIAGVFLVLRLRRVTGVSGRRSWESLGLVSMMIASPLVVLSMNPSGSMRGAGMMSLVLSMEKGRLSACPVVAVGCLSFDRADRGPRRL